MIVKISGADIHVNVRGEGEDALLLHGIPDTAEIWNSLIHRIEGQYRCYAPDMPGIHRSEVPSDYRFELEHYAEYIDELVKTLKLTTPLTLIIHDWGGIFGMLWACKYPHKVKRIVGGDFPFSHLYNWHPWARIWQTPLLGEMSMLGMNWPLFRWELRRSSKRLSEEDMRQTYFGRVTKSEARRTVLKLYRSAAPHRFTHWTSKQKALSEQVPIDLIWGYDDPHVHPHHAQLIHHRSLTVVPNCGHWAPQEAPDVYASTLLSGD